MLMLCSTSVGNFDSPSYRAQVNIADFWTDDSPVSECETDDSEAQSVTATSAKKI